MGQVERVRSHEVPVQEAAERHHEAKPRPDNRVNQVGVHGEDHSGQARLQGSTGRSRVSRGQGLHQDRCAHWIARRLLQDALSSSSKRLGLQRVRCSVSVLPVRRHRETIAVADASQKSASWDEARASVCCYWFDLRDERCWTCTARAQQESARGSRFRGVKSGTRPLLSAWTLSTSGCRAHTCR